MGIRTFYRVIPLIFGKCNEIMASLILICVVSSACKSDSNFEENDISAKPEKAAIKDSSDAESKKVEEGKKRVITQGSFSVRTSPEDPEEGEDYILFVEVSLGRDINHFDINDLKVRLKGTDGYRLIIEDGECRQGEKVIGSDKEPEIDDLSSLCFVVPSDIGEPPGFSVRIPGGDAKVKDQIDIESVLLNEKQEIELLF